MLSENLDPSIVFDPRDEEGSLVFDLLKPVQIIVALVEGVDAVRHDDNILLRRPNIGHFAVAQGDKAWNVSGEIEFRVKLDCAFVLPVVRPVVLRQAQIDGRAVDRVERIVKFESVPRCTSDGAFKDLLEKRFENLRQTPVHGIGERRFRHGFHAEVVKTALVGHQPAGDLAQGVFAGDLGVKAGQKLPPCGKMLAVTVPGDRLDLFVETISGDELEKLLKDAIVKHCRSSYAQIKDFRHL